MPVPVAAKVGVVAASVAVAAAIAIYEIPEVRRAAEDLRRRIAIALHSLGENLDPSSRQPSFNRPEDAEGFYQSHDVDADEETRRRQREELMYWNMRREEQRQRERQASEQRSRGSTFDDFLRPDRAGDSGTLVYNTGANAWDAEPSNALRRRGNAEGVRGLNAAMLSSPFSDEHGIELQHRTEFSPPARPEAMSDIYSATPRVQSPVVAPAPPVPVQPQPQPAPAPNDVLFDFGTHDAPSEYATAASEAQSERAATPTATTSRSMTLERELAEDEYMTAGQDDRAAADAYASIQAWARNSANTGFYSPLPSTPTAPFSEPEVISDGQLTPTDSESVAGSGVNVGHDAVSVTEGRDLDVMSESDEGIPTPGSWSEVGSVISEGESAARA
ncbi:hypothetical protein MYCTH_2298820 [Thermothelomyces thermophilus ATCC 42464]|uniref:Uncharacterized protein n=1 Tax=Thermothelomyces thermophilus (strain ATCC 42464 / BCRC 31852 / DSM 1799) TaxID=573729 RepID=G2Q3F4_THET4|nr:uncharacterized protein MYCTH_2298820 [Thermothelomyces thermophilus ATCC 42464]AEO55214.1 hypothetical protein MYCTH_2298820 [Thermothelomyces thermophilus ATCC 42464]